MHTSYCRMVTTKCLKLLCCIAHLSLINRISVQIILNNLANAWLQHKHSCFSQRKLKAVTFFCKVKQLALLFMSIYTEILLTRDKSVIQRTTICFSCLLHHHNITVCTRTLSPLLVCNMRYATCSCYSTITRWLLCSNSISQSAQLLFHNITKLCPLLHTRCNILIETSQ